ncbi:MAG: adenylyl-sulfate kinase [Deltaproteobacteria bacterium]
MGTPIEKSGFTLWLTGMRGAGKSTLAGYLGQRLRGVGRPVEVLDADELDKAAIAGGSETKEGRLGEVRRLGYLSKLLSRNNVVSIAASLSPDRDARDQNRRDIGRYVEVFVDCPVETLLQRDHKGLYKKALAGELTDFIGVTAPYEPPANPEVIVRTHEERVEESAHKIFQALLDLGYLKPVEVSAIIGQKARRRPLPPKRPSRPARAARRGTARPKKSPVQRKAVRPAKATSKSTPKSTKRRARR